MPVGRVRIHANAGQSSAMLARQSTRGRVAKNFIMAYKTDVGRYDSAEFLLSYSVSFAALFSSPPIILLSLCKGRSTTSTYAPARHLRATVDSFLPKVQKERRLCGEPCRRCCHPSRKVELGEATSSSTANKGRRAENGEKETRTKRKKRQRKTSAHTRAHTHTHALKKRRRPKFRSFSRVLFRCFLVSVFFSARTKPEESFELSRVTVVVRRFSFEGGRGKKRRKKAERARGKKRRLRIWPHDAMPFFSTLLRCDRITHAEHSALLFTAVASMQFVYAPGGKRCGCTHAAAAAVHHRRASFEMRSCQPRRRSLLQRNMVEPPGAASRR